MRNSKFYAVAFLMLLLVVGCEQGSILETTNENTLEDAQSIMEDRAGCDDCSPRPANISKFKNALRQCEYEYTGKSTEEAARACTIGEFSSSCNEAWMIITSGGDKDDRSEVKLDQCMSFNHGNEMQAELVAENIPADGDRGLTIAQIHNRYCDVKRPMLRLDIVDEKLRMIIAKSRTGSGNYDRLEDANMSYSDGNRLVVNLKIRRGNWISYYIKNKKSRSYL